MVVQPRPRLVVVTNAMALAGMGSVATAVSAAVTLVVNAVDGGPPVVPASGLTVAAFSLTWFDLPTTDRLGRRQ